MKYLSFSALILMFGSCVNMKSTNGTGHIITQKRTVEPFLAIHAENMVNVEIIRGDVQSVEVEADDNVIAFIETKVSGNTLKIALKDINNVNNVTLKVRVTTPELKEINASTSAEITSKDTLNSAEKIVLKVSTSGGIKLNVSAPAVDAFGSSSGELTVGGRTKDLNAEANTSSGLDLYGLKAENVTADASTSADIKVFASVNMNGTANTSGNISYRGGAANVVKKENTSGSVTAE